MFQKNPLFLLVAAGLVAAGVSTMANANPRVVYGGGNPETSTYSGIMVPHVLKIFKQHNIGGYQWSGPSDGSAENIMQVGINPLAFGIAQSDIVADALAKGEPIKVWFPNMAPECFHVISKDGTTFADALRDRRPIYVGGQLGGTAFSILRLLKEGYEIDPKSVSLVFESATKAAGGGVGVFVQRPDPDAQIYQDRADQGFTFSGIDSFEAELAGYVPLEVSIKDSGVLLGLGAKTQKFRTTCMTATLIGHDPVTMPAGTRETRYMKKLVIPKLKTISADEMVAGSQGGWLSEAVSSVNAAASEAKAGTVSLIERITN